MSRHFETKHIEKHHGVWFIVERKNTILTTPATSSSQASFGTHPLQNMSTHRAHFGQASTRVQGPSQARVQGLGQVQGPGQVHVHHYHGPVIINNYHGPDPAPQQSNTERLNRALGLHGYRDPGLFQ